MKCPLFVSAQMSYSGDQAFHAEADDCLEFQCAWWDEGQCIIKSIGDDLYSIKMSLLKEDETDE